MQFSEYSVDTLCTFNMEVTVLIERTKNSPVVAFNLQSFFYLPGDLMVMKWCLR